MEQNAIIEIIENQENIRTKLNEIINEVDLCEEELNKISSATHYLERVIECLENLQL